MGRWWITAAALLCCLMLQGSAAADPQQDADEDAPFGDLLEGLDSLAAPEASQTEKDAAAPEPAESFDANPLAAAGAAMQQAGDRLRQGQLDDSTRRAQQQAIEHLDRFLAAQQSRQSDASQSRPTQQPQSAGEETEPRSGESPDRPDTPQSADRPSVAGRRPGMAPEGGLPDDLPRVPPDLEQAVWGHLPERMRRQLQASMPEEFLPAYREAIRDYFQRLTELQDDGT